MKPRLRFAPPAFALLVSLASAVLIAGFASGSVGPRPARIAAPRPLTPADGERLVSTTVRFTANLPDGAREPRLVLSKEWFDPRGWSELPASDHFLVTALPAGGVDLARTGLGFDTDEPLWWAVAALDPKSGELIVSEVRTVTPTRRFPNRVAAPLASFETARGRLPAPAATAGARPPIRLEAGFTFVPGRDTPAVPAELSAARAPRDERAGAPRSVLVQFAGENADEARARIAASGGTIIAYVPERAYLVRVSDTGRAQLESAAGAPWVGTYEPAYKLSPRIDRASATRASFTAQLFPDADRGAVLAAIVALGGTNVETFDNGINKLARFELDAATVASAATLEAVAWIEPTPRFELYNDNVQWVVQTGLTNNRKVWDQGIRGQGQVVMTSDSGVRTSHDQFRDPALTITAFGDFPTHRKIIAYKLGSSDPGVVFGDHSAASFHGTHTGGTINGNDDVTTNTSPRDGVAKLAKFYFMDISGPALANGVAPFADLNDEFLPSYLGNAGGAARISSNSWGAPVAGAYDLNSMQVDQFMFAHPDYLISISNGNAGTAGSVGSPASAKNCLSIGGTGNGASENNIYTSTSRGPAADGRRKPTLCTPGLSVFSAGGGNNTSYVSLSGTSMSSPGAAGATALVRQYLTEGWYPTGAAVPANSIVPSAALLKAMVVNSADNAVIGFTAPDNNVGWGRMTLDNALYFPGDARKLLIVDQSAGLVEGQYVDYQINVTDGAQPLEVTLVWTDAPGSPAAAVQIVNDLDLTVSKSPTTYLGNVYSAGNSATGGTRDSINVEEAVRVATPAAGLWTVRVSAPSVPLGPQPYALVITGGVAGGAAALALDRPEYAATDTVEVQIIDSNAVGPLSVTISSPTEPGGETVTLTGGSGVFHGTIPVAPTLAGGGDGILSVSSGDALTATYDDASPAATLTATAAILSDAPIITNVASTALAAGVQQITWTTDRPATSIVHFGTEPPLLSIEELLTYTTEHSVTLDGLTPGTTYQYDALSRGITGSLTADSLGGAHRSFTVKMPGDVLMVFGDPASTLNPTWTNALDALGYDYDVLNRPLIDPPAVGNATSGLRGYRSVLWQVGPDDYPPFTDNQRAAIDSLLEGGGRLAVSGHDIGWGLCDPASPGYTPDRATWFSTGLKATFLADPLTWTQEVGVAADPISGSYTGAGISYIPIRDGGAGDEVGLAASSGGTGTFDWLDNDATADNDGFRWESSTVRGSPANAAWGGYTSRLATMFFEWSRLSTTATTNDATRSDVLDKTILWLLGHTRPTAQISSPNGGETFTGDDITVNFTAAAAGGFSIASRRLEYSVDGGDTWRVAIASVPGSTSASWDLTGGGGGDVIPNSTRVMLRLIVTDDGTPALSRSDATDNVFTINRTGGDLRGPVVVAGSIRATPAPVLRGNSASFAARLSDAETGGGTVAQAEWSFGNTPATAGAGTAMTGSFGTTTVDVNAALPSPLLPLGTLKLWVRGRDTAGNWGAAERYDVIVNGTGPVGVGDSPTVTFLAPSAPNPFRGRTTLRFGLARPGDVDLSLFDLQGRKVRTLVRGAQQPGTRTIAWDGLDESGNRVRPGVYLVRLTTPEGVFRTRAVALN